MFIWDIKYLGETIIFITGRKIGIVNDMGNSLRIVVQHILGRRMLLHPIIPLAGMTVQRPPPLLSLRKSNWEGYFGGDKRHCILPFPYLNLSPTFAT
jgi:hypothetical protein